MKMSDRVKENVIEWIENGKTATVTLSQKRHITKIKKLAAECPEDVKIVAENADGSICAHMPVKYIKIGRPRAMSDENKEKAKQRIMEYRLKLESITHD